MGSVCLSAAKKISHQDTELLLSRLTLTQWKEISGMHNTRQKSGRKTALKHSNTELFGSPFIFFLNSTYLIRFSKNSTYVVRFSQPKKLETINKKIIPG